MRRAVGISIIVLAIQAGHANAGPTPVRCDDIATADYAIDGLLDDWGKQPVLAHIGAPRDGAIALRCAWDGTALALALVVDDDRVVRSANGRGHDDHVAVSLSAGGRATTIDAFPGTSIAKPRVVKSSPKIAVADSLQPKGFSIEARIPAAAIANVSTSTAAIDLAIVFHDSDAATGGKDVDLPLDVQIVLGDRADLLDDFLKATRLKKRDVTLDVMAELDPDRKGKERLVAGGTVIGVLTDRFAYVEIPGKAADVKSVALLPLGPRGQQVIAAVVRQTGNGGSRDVLMLWTVWSGQLSALAQIEIAKRVDKNALESGYRVVAGAKGPELVVEPKPAVGFTAETWNEEPADDADPIVAPWDATRGGVGYTLKGAELVRRNLPARKPRAR